MRGARTQRGVVLVVSLLMIAVLGLLATASMNFSGGSLLIVGNSQEQDNAESVVQRVVENTISRLDNFTAPAPLPAGTREGGLNVARSAPVCVRSSTMPGFSLVNPLSLQHNYYEFDAGAADPAGGANSRARVGVRILLNAGTCSP
ncbi:hypothetical protein [Spectribacter hydrogenoxidans]|uniref:Type 4 fimbrial biogenesis protein PilX N-terminal domain-containing protein n=1 Tax=Spectribacter hydrogenoxidans TaxID=3075608 RepID=A0ABU3BWH8_9GAMM|nr:hypothetical protein [Salinisphaera sp. W335]MDT0633663.1 hypothetical protein [Salinisphaera sp. W335]